MNENFIFTILFNISALSFDPLNQLSFCQAHKKLFGIYLDKEIVTIYIYIYIYKFKRNIYCCYAPVESHQRSHGPPISNHFSLIFEPSSSY